MSTFLARTGLIRETVRMTRIHLANTGRMIAATSDTGYSILPVNLLLADKALITARLEAIHHRDRQEVDTMIVIRHRAAISDSHSTKDRFQEEIARVIMRSNSIATGMGNVARGIMGTITTGKVAGRGKMEVSVGHQHTVNSSRSQICKRKRGTQQCRLRPRPLVIELAGIMMLPVKTPAKMTKK
jgi:hypothetical protein